MKKKPNITNLILSKSKKSILRLGVTFILIWLTILIYMCFFIFNLSGSIKNIYGNDLTHIIEVRGDVKNHLYKKMDQSKAELVYKLLDDEEISYDSIPICKISNGILMQNTQEGVTIYGILENSILDYADENNDVLYSKLNIENIDLVIPNINIDKNGNVFSDSYNVMNFKVNNVESSLVENVLLNSQTDIPIFFANEKTFSNIISNMYNESQENSIIDLEEVIIYIEDINKITEAKLLLEKNDYYVSYAFDAFESLPSFIFKSSILFIVVLGIIVVFGVIYIAITYKNYIIMQEKDMGILKHFDYSNAEINKIYLLPLKKVLYTIIGITVIFNLRQYDRWFVSFVVTILMMLLVCGIYQYIKCSVVKKITKKNILELIKDKEAE